MKKLNLLPLFLSFAILLAAMPALTQEETSGWKSPGIVTPGTSGIDCVISPPLDAIILFDGTDLSMFRSTRGIYLQGRYEIQVLDSYDNETYFDGQAGAVYSQKPPLVNASRKPGEWNVYDIIYTAPTFKTDGTYRTRPVVTVIHNGVLVQNQTTILGITNKDYSGYPPGEAHGAGPILLQDHDFPVSFRNIWIREL